MRAWRWMSKREQRGANHNHYLRLVRYAHTLWIFFGRNTHTQGEWVRKAKFNEDWRREWIMFKWAWINGNEEKLIEIKLCVEIYMYGCVCVRAWLIENAVNTLYTYKWSTRSVVLFHGCCCIVTEIIVWHELSASRHKNDDDNNFYFASWHFNAHNSFCLSSMTLAAAAVIDEL